MTKKSLAHDIEKARSQLRSDPQFVLEQCSELLKRCEADSPHFADVLLISSRASIHVGNNQDARTKASQALEIAKRAAYRRLEGLGYNELGVLALIDVNYDEALEMHSRALDLLSKFGSELDQARVLLNVGNVCQFTNRFSESLDYYERALEKLNITDDVPLRAIVRSNMATLYHNYLYDFEEALTIAKENLETFKQLGDNVGIGKTLHNIGLHYRSLDKIHESIDAFQQSLTYTKQFGEVADVASDYGMLILSYLEIGDLESADELLNEVSELEKAGKFDGHSHLPLMRATAKRARLAGDWAPTLRLVNETLPQYMYSVPFILEIYNEELEYYESIEDWKNVSVVLRKRCEHLKMLYSRSLKSKVYRMNRTLERSRKKGEAEAERQRNAELGALVRHLEEVVAENERYIALLAHELKNPLSTIRTVTSMLGTDETITISERMELERDIHAISTRMFEMVNKTLRVAASENTTDGSLTDARTTFSYSLHTLSALATEKNIRILSSQSEQPLWVQASDASLAVVFDNLISNAIKYSPLGETIECHLGLERTLEKGAMVVLRVADHGPGISDTDRLRLFSPFSKLSLTPTGGEDSTGIGLYLVKRMVDRMNGRIWYENTSPEGGATFLVELQLANPPYGNETAQ